MKNQFRFVLLTMVIGGLTGCQRSGKAVNDLLVETLGARYEEEFVVQSIGGSWGTADDSTIKAYVSPVRDETKEFKAQVKKDFSVVTDDYATVLVAEKLESALKDVFSDIYSQYHVKVQVYDTLWEGGTKDLDLASYLSNRDDVEYIVQLYIKTDFLFNKPNELAKLTQLIEKYLELGYPSTRFNFFYLKPVSFELFNATYPTIENVYEDYRSVEHAVNYLKIGTDKVSEMTAELFQN